MKLIGTIDDKLIAVIQDAYLWLWDRSGATVGMCIFVCIMPGVVLDSVGSLWWRLLIGLLMTLVTCFAHQTQMTSLAAQNAIARSWRSSPFRASVIAYDVFAIATNIAAGSLMNFGFNLLSLLVVYLWCIQVRDREPPQKQAFARQAS